MNQRGAPRISVVIPCFNVAGYLQACLEALMTQTHDSFEVLCINDGSTDQTGSLLDAQAAQDSRFSVIHQEQQGPSAARNVGVARSRAPFICFIDSDDVVVPQYLELLEALQQRYDADMVCCGFRHMAPGTQTHLTQFASTQEAMDAVISTSQVMAAPEALTFIAQSNINLAFWGKLFKRSLIESHPFPEGKIYEDLWCLGNVVADASRVAHTPVPLYYYIYRPESITRSKTDNLQAFMQFGEALEKFEAVYAQQLQLTHATDDPLYCLHLVHRLCAQQKVLLNSECEAALKESLLQTMREEIHAAYQLAILRGISPLHPQLIRAALILWAPTELHDLLMHLYRRFA